MSFRPGARLIAAFRPAFRQPLLRRRVQTAADAAPAAEAESGFQKLWNSPVGPKTVHFWAPIMKWSIVLVGVSDFTRPADQLSLFQNASLIMTGAIWTRWCFVIRPKNIFLATVNFFVFLTGAVQVSRIYLYNQSIKGTEKEAKAEGAELKKELEGVEKKVEKAIKG